ncbi:BspC domain-containing protein [Chitinolyticbacter albus]|uniref:BspC domain-containing protein n=1 Tax=Chitinolyticbacter albus TaxID=2961951 RepID=UPI00210AB847|nr:hypothetical protein [Chitinolyticbacter albus]
MNRYVLLLVAAAPVTTYAAASPQPVIPDVARCYERLLERVPKRTPYTSILASETQLARGRVERWQDPFSSRITQTVQSRVVIPGTGWRERTEVPLWLKCGLNNGQIVTWEVERRVSQQPG